MEAKTFHGTGWLKEELDAAKKESENWSIKVRRVSSQVLRDKNTPKKPVRLKAAAS